MDGNPSRVRLIQIQYNPGAERVRRLGTSAGREIDAHRIEVTEMRGLVEKDKVKEFQVTVKIGFRLEDQPA